MKLQPPIFTQFSKFGLFICLFLTMGKAAAQHFDNLNIETDIMLRGGKITAQKDFSGTLQLPSETIFDGKYYAILKLESALTTETAQKLTLAGVELLDYVPYHAFVVSIPQQADLRNVAPLIRSIFPIRAADKRGFQQRDLAFSDYARASDGRYHLRVASFKNISRETSFFALQKLGFTLIKATETIENSLAVAGTPAQIEALATASFVQFFELIAPPPVPEDERARSLHRTSLLFSETANGRKFDGTGEGIVIPDDGVVGPHIDFHGRMTQAYADLTALGGTHGDMTGGIAVGAGNLNPLMRGMASGALLKTYTINGYPHVTAAVSNLNLGYHITSTSYSNGCNAYTTESQQMDNQMLSNPTLLHIFSGGNSSGSNCGYAGGFGSTSTTTVIGWGNITGGYKLGKNVIASANVQPNDAIDVTSSKGPAIDGRIKPDIAANGNSQNSTAPDNTYQVGGGTSAASPGIAGVSAQLYQAYRSLNNDVRPNAALIKATLMNTADEVGNFGPDYTYGFGRINADRAFRVLQNRNYLSDTITNGQTRQIPLVVPAGTKQVKVMLYWAEPAGSTTAGFALVNDLDLKLRKNTSTFLPWVLRREAVVDSLNKPATKGIDRLNNVEQVQIDADSSNASLEGNYTIEVSGFSVPQATAHRFFVVYQFENDSIRVVFPNGGEGLNPLERPTVRWDAYISPNSTNETDLFNIEFSADGGTTWQLMATTTNIRDRAATITNLTQQTGRGRIRISRTSMVSDISDENFSNVAIPTGLQIAAGCLDSTTFAWNGVSGATRYEVYKLGNKFMDSVTQTNAFNYKFALGITDSTWFSVRAILPDGGKSRRAIAIPKAKALVNCAVQNDAMLNTVLAPAQRAFFNCGTNFSNIPLTVQIRNTGLNPISTVVASYTVNNQTVRDTLNNLALAINANYSHTFSRPLNFPTNGVFPAVISVKLIGDLNTSNDTIRTIFTVNSSREATPITETFESTTFPPSGWSFSQNIPTDTVWRKIQVISPTGTPTNAAMFNNFQYAQVGREIYLVSWLVDLRGQQGMKLNFDVAYRVYGTSYDGLAIYVSKNCGANWLPTVYRKVGAVLATSTAVTTSAWFPALQTDWRREEVNLNIYRDSVILIGFANIAAYGQNLFIDNVNVSQSVPTQNIAVGAPMIGFAPNPVEDFCQLNFRNFDIFQAENLEMEAFDAAGRSVQTDKMKVQNGAAFDYSINTSNWASGLHVLRIRAAAKNGEIRHYTLKIIKK